MAENTHLTWSFINELNSQNIGKKPKNPEAQPFALDAGFYFEAALYNRIYNLLNHSGHPQKDPLTYSSSQKAAIGKFRTAINAGNGRALQLEQAVTKAADEAANQILRDLLKIFAKEFEDKNIEIPLNRKIDLLHGIKLRNIAVAEDQGAKGNPLGDLEIEINGKKFIYELKWQSAKDYPTRWFSGMSDVTLFGDESPVGTFYSYLTSKDEIKQKFWNYKENHSYWKTGVTTTALRSFLDDSFKKNNGEALTYFLRKGNGPSSIQNSPDTIKTVIHAGFVGMQITGFEDLVEELSGNAASRQGVSQLIKGKNLLLYQDKDKNNIAGFGVDKYKNSHVQNRKETTFSFSFFISQKYLNSNATNQRFHNKEK